MAVEAKQIVAIPFALLRAKKKGLLMVLTPLERTKIPLSNRKLLECKIIHKYKLPY
jgi:hypothetical protein